MPGDAVSPPKSEPSGLPLRGGDVGPSVRDLHRRLSAAGYHDTGNPDRFDDHTEKALREFQASRRLVEDGICARQTWSSLVDADYRLGERMIYLRSPMTRGDDVTDLQQRLGSLPQPIKRNPRPSGCLRTIGVEALVGVTLHRITPHAVTGPACHRVNHELFVGIKKLWIAGPSDFDRRKRHQLVGRIVFGQRRQDQSRANIGRCHDAHCGSESTNNRTCCRCSNN